MNTKTMKGITSILCSAILFLFPTCKSSNHHSHGKSAQAHMHSRNFDELKQAGYEVQVEEKLLPYQNIFIARSVLK